MIVTIPPNCRNFSRCHQDKANPRSFHPFSLIRLTQPPFWSVAFAFPKFRVKTFMQSEPTVISKSALADIHPPTPSSTTQHGNDTRYDETVFDHLHRGEIEGHEEEGAHGFGSEGSRLGQLSPVDDLPSEDTTPGHLRDTLQANVSQDDARVYVLHPRKRVSLTDLPNGNIDTIRDRFFLN